MPRKKCLKVQKLLDEAKPTRKVQRLLVEANPRRNSVFRRSRSQIWHMRFYWTLWTRNGSRNHKSFILEPLAAGREFWKCLQNAEVTRQSPWRNSIFRRSRSQIGHLRFYWTIWTRNGSRNRKSFVLELLAAGWEFSNFSALLELAPFSSLFLLYILYFSQFWLISCTGSCLSFFAPLEDSFYGF